MADKLDVTAVVAEARARRAASKLSAEAAFRQATELRLSALERHMAEVKARVNGLLWLIVGAVVLELVQRLFLR